MKIQLQTMTQVLVAAWTVAYPLKHSEIIFQVRLLVFWALCDVKNVGVLSTIERLVASLAVTCQVRSLLSANLCWTWGLCIWQPNPESIRSWCNLNCSVNLKYLLLAEAVYWGWPTNLHWVKFLPDFSVAVWAKTVLSLYFEVLVLQMQLLSV